MMVTIAEAGNATRDDYGDNILVNPCTDHLKQRNFREMARLVRKIMETDIPERTAPARPSEDPVILFGTADAPWSNSLPHPAVTVDGVTVYLPRTREGDPNVQTGATVAYGLDEEGVAWAVSDYMDDKIGTTQFWNLASGAIPSGWEVCLEMVGSMYEGDNKAFSFLPANLTTAEYAVHSGLNLEICVGRNGAGLSICGDTTDTISGEGFVDIGHARLQVDCKSLELSLYEPTENAYTGPAALALETWPAIETENTPTCTATLCIDPGWGGLTSEKVCHLHEVEGEPYGYGSLGGLVDVFESTTSDGEHRHSLPSAMPIPTEYTHRHLIFNQGEHGHGVAPHCHGLEVPEHDHCSWHTHALAEAGHHHDIHKHDNGEHHHGIDDPGHRHDMSGGVMQTGSYHRHFAGLPERKTVIPIKRVA